jgi:hypothetical protein
MHQGSGSVMSGPWVYFNQTSLNTNGAKVVFLQPKKCAGWATNLEPAMLTAINLDEFT